MGRFNPNKLHVRFQPGTTPVNPVVPRRYTLTHSDRTGHLFLTIGSDYDGAQISGWYTRWMRDEVLAEWLPHRAEDAPSAEESPTEEGSDVQSLLVQRESHASSQSPKVAEDTLQRYQLHVYVRVRGGRVIGSARHRFRALQRELPLALQAIRTGDNWLHVTHANLDASEVLVHCASAQSKYNSVEPYGTIGDYRMPEVTTLSPKRTDSNRRVPSATETSKTDRHSVRR